MIWYHFLIVKMNYYLLILPVRLLSGDCSPKWQDGSSGLIYDLASCLEFGPQQQTGQPS